MTAANEPLTIKQGSTFTFGFNWHLPDAMDPTVAGAARNLTGWTARMQIRKRQGSPVLLSATTENDMIALGGSTGRVDLHFPPAATTALTTKSAVYDLELVDPDGEVYALLEGAVTIDPNITQDDGEPVLTA